ncbi:MAG TPA: alpha/beta fold hydrolase [Polyangiales bacterium]|nr:alpha/beta fold hydrolase [Polyangiales bacterium]
MNNSGSLVRKAGVAVVVVVAALLAGKKDMLLAKLRGVSPEVASVLDSAPAKDLLAKVAPGAAHDPKTDAPVAAPAKAGVLTLPGLRKALKATIDAGERDESAAPEPPAGVLEKVSYDAPLGKNVAYVTPVQPGDKRPGVVWIHGGFNFGLDSSAWEDAPRANDQSGAAFRKAGIAQLYPALRGTSQNPGRPECFLGEVDDVLAAAEFLAQRPDVDPQRVYLAGHSTGALLVLLAVESSTRFRAAFAFGPVADARQYGDSGCLTRSAPESEWKPRAPVEFLSEITAPTLIIDGSAGNAGGFPMMQPRVGSAPVRFLAIAGGDHFNVLAPGTELVAKAILADRGPAPAFDAITADAIQSALKAN